MHIRKRLLAVLLVMILTGGVMFGGTLEIKQQETTPEEPGWNSRKETIYVWYTDEALSGYIGTAAVKFSADQDVNVIPLLKSASGYLEGINSDTLNPEKQMPDAYILNNDELEKAYLAGLAVETEKLSMLWADRAFPETALSAVAYEGHTAAYPLYYDTSVLVYNQDYLEMWVQQQSERALEEDTLPEEAAGEDGTLEDLEPAEGENEGHAEEIPLETIIQENGLPITVDGILHFADTFDAPMGVDGVMKWDVSDIFYNYWVVGSYLIVGGDSGDDDTNINIYNEQTIDCLEIYQALNQFFYIEPDSVNYESVLQDFIDGRLVFTIGSTDVLRRLEDAKEEGRFEHHYGIAMIPQVGVELNSRPLSVTNAVCVNGYSKHKDLADQFAQYLAMDFAGELYERSGKMPACIAANDGKPMQQIFLKQYGRSVSLPKMMEIGNLWLRLEALFSKVWNGEEVQPLVLELEEQISTQLKLE